MKTLEFSGAHYQADRIVKDQNNIIGYEKDGSFSFSFKGITDFSLFSLVDGEKYDLEESIDAYLLDLEYRICSLSLSI